MTIQSIMTLNPLEELQALIQQPWSKVREELAASASYKKTWYELSELSQAELADIGLTRSDIPRIAEQAAAMCRK